MEARHASTPGLPQHLDIGSWGISGVSATARHAIPIPDTKAQAATLHVQYDVNFKWGTPMWIPDMKDLDQLEE